MPLHPIVTRFRAYQLEGPGSSFSYFADGHFTIIEGRLNDANRDCLIAEMKGCGVSSADLLHITSWDQDHCSAGELEELLLTFLPSRIECPGYEPHTDNGKASLELIQRYHRSHKERNAELEVAHITPDYIGGLSVSNELAFKDVLYHPRWIDPDCDNNNSTVKLFRRGSFNLLSLGDVECQNISARLRRDKYLTRETDVMILAHHGADNGFTNKEFLSRINPTVAICSADHSNMYDHPRDEIRQLLFDQKIPLFTTKTGDVLIRSIGDHAGQFEVTNLISGSTKVSSQYQFRSKKARLLSFNADTVRQLYAPQPAYRRIRR